MGSAGPERVGPEYVGPEHVGPQFVGADMSGAVFRDVDLARMRGMMLTEADIDGDITGLWLNGVEVAPLVEAELDRRHPERHKLRAATVDGFDEEWAHHRFAVRDLAAIERQPSASSA